MTDQAKYFDIQINGYAGVDWNQDDLSAERMHEGCRLLEESGVEGILATVVTEKIDAMCGRLARLVELREQDEQVRRVVAGFHIEGPFLNPMAGYRGAHPEDAIIPPDADAMKRLLDAAGGLTRIVTLAPEKDAGGALTRLLADQGIVVSAGHCNPSLDELRAGIDSGLAMFTHLGNGIPMEITRHDNVIERALSVCDRLWIGFIADGAHIPFFALGNYLKVTGLDRAYVVTDCTSAASLPPGRYRLARWEIEIGEDRVARSPDGSHLVGSAITMPETAKNLREKMGLDPNQVRTLTYDNPRRAIGMAG